MLPSMGTKILYRHLWICSSKNALSGFRGYQTNADSPQVRRKDDPQNHIPVLLQDVVDIFKPGRRKTLIDMTFGGGGHAAALLEKCPDIHIIGLDRDVNALKYGSQLQKMYGSERLRLFHGSFTDLEKLLTDSCLPTFDLADGVLFDVGTSAMQNNDKQRGFALKHKGPLDMRMNAGEDIPTAADVVNKLDESDLRRVLRKYGQEKKAKQIARGIVEHRQAMGPILTTRDLQDVVSHVCKVEDIDSPTDKLGRMRHPATLTFQALRIFVNDELNQLYNGLKVAHRLLKPKGTCAVISFHSLEHTIVHQTFNARSALRKEVPFTDDLSTTELMFPWKTDSFIPIKPSDEEIKSNPRSRSAELRVAVKKSRIVLP